MKALLAAFLTLAASLTAFAQTPSLMSYQGRVSDSAGTFIGTTTPVNRTVTFKFYTASTGGTPVYVEAQTVTISSGEFSVLLGNGTGVSGFKGPGAPALTPYVTLPSVMTGNVYLGITVDDGTGAVDAEITPRQQIVSAAYAFRSKLAEGLVDGALATSMLADTSVTTNKIGGNQVTTAKIADANIVTAKIADANITSAKIADGNVTHSKIAANAITSDKIADGNVGTADLANNAVDGAKIADNSITSVDIADGNIHTADLVDLAVTNNKIGNNVIDYNKLAAAIQQSLCPVGTILPFAGDNAPSGWIMCNGATVSRTTYATLYSVVGNRFGHGDNSSTFHVPDFRGRFLRGRDANAGRDEDRNSRTAMNGGGAVGDAVGSVQGDQLHSHTHDYWDTYYSESGGSGPQYYTNSKGSGDTDNDNEPWQVQRTGFTTGGSETRPENASVNYIIKY